MSNTFDIDVKHTAEEIYLLRCSLLSGESLVFQDSTSSHDSTSYQWDNYLDRYSELTTAQEYLQLPPPDFSIIIDNARLRIDVQYSTTSSLMPVVAVKGDDITRTEQEWWQNIIEEKLREVRDSEFPTYELISSHLLPLLHSSASRTPGDSMTEKRSGIETAGHDTCTQTTYHALLTSHHLISSTKRKNLQQWSSQLRISGFAKVGYPGCIYCEGEQERLEEFVGNIKAMQWLALRVRFIEPLPKDIQPQDAEKRRWIEMEKVGEVVEEMRRLGRESFVVEMGIGSASQK